ncbi:MAG: short-chain fatty acyl-CoA regulator family protein, partial [Tistlia sp.]
DEEQRHLVFLDNASISTRRFQLARLAAELGWEEVIEREADDPRLTSKAARAQAFRALASYLASTLLLPYERFQADAVRTRYDVELLRQRYDASVEQVCHRLVTLRRPGREGVPFAFLRANPAGFTTKRFPLPGLALARHGHACPLWAIYGSFQTPGRVIRQLAAFPDGSRYLFIARTVTKQPATFQEQPFLHAVMLACEEIHADRTVYADGLDLAAAQSATPVGPACRLCPRSACLHRAEAPIVAPRPRDGG